MSGFLSRKYLQYRDLLAENQPSHIDTDLSCLGCGYNLRGLNYGRNCPECGDLITRPPAGSSPDSLLTGDESMRRLVRNGLSLGAFCLITAALARIVFFVNLVFTVGAISTAHYLILGFVLSAMWWIACAMMMRGRPRRSERAERYARIIIWSQGLWLLGYTLFALRVQATVNGTGGEIALHIANLLVRGVAGIGALGVAFFMMRAAEDAELDDPAARLNNVIWLLPIFTIITAHVPAWIPWMISVFVFGLLLAWAWFMFQWGRSLWEMSRHIGWHMRIAVERAGRHQRIDERKRELQAEVDAKIRPVERARPITYGDRDRHCKRCGYNLRGLKTSNACPECGGSVATFD